MIYLLYSVAKYKRFIYIYLLLYREFITIYWVTKDV